MFDAWSGWWERGGGAPARPMALRPDEEPVRPARVEIVPWDACLGLMEYAPFARSVVPFELVEPGDRQLVVQGRARTTEPEEPAALDVLSAFPTVTSLIVDRSITLGRPLPQIRELTVMPGTEAPGSDTLGNLSNLERLCHGRRFDEEQLEWEPLLDMPLRGLRFDAYQMGTIEPIRRLGALEQLRMESQTFESIAPLADCTRLTWLALGWFKGMQRLGALERLRHLELNEGTVSSLRAFRNCRELRSLTVFGRRLKSLSGIEGMTALEDLFLYNVGVADLEPLAELPLRRIRLDMPTKVVDFAPLGRIGTLESLIVHPKASRIAAEIAVADFRSLRSLRELALLGIADGDGWEFLLDLPQLQRIQLWGAIDGEAAGPLRERFPEAQVDVRSTQGPRPEPFAVSRLPDGVWSIFEGVSELLDVDDNFVAERRLRQRLRAADAELLNRLTFDSDADHLGVSAEAEADIRRVADELRALCNVKR